MPQRGSAGVFKGNLRLALGVLHAASHTAKALKLAAHGMSNHFEL